MCALGRAGNFVHRCIDDFAVRSFCPIAVVKVDDRDGDIWRWVDGDVIAAVNNSKGNACIILVEAEEHCDILRIIGIVLVSFTKDELGLIQARREPNAVGSDRDAAREQHCTD